MPEASGNSIQRHWKLLLVLIIGSFAACGVMVWDRVGSTSEGFLSRDTQKPAPPPPSDKVVDAPGPDNAVQRLAPQSELPPQPPSPTKSQADPTKKPQGV